MILHRITLQNFGIYAGEHRFDLKPKGDGRFQQPIILLRGQNGAGKSTLMEAIRLGLHGKLSLGNRSTQKSTSNIWSGASIAPPMDRLLPLPPSN